MLGYLRFPGAVEELLPPGLGAVNLPASISSAVGFRLDAHAVVDGAAEPALPHDQLQQVLRKHGLLKQ